MPNLNTFEQTILDYLVGYSEKDPIFAVKLDKDKIQDCCNYIIDQVQKSGRKGFTDEEVFHMARSYYDDGMPKCGKQNAEVVVNHTIELTEEEKAEAKAKALEEYQEAEKKKLEAAAKKEAEKNTKALETQKQKDVEEGQISLFDLLGEN